MFRRQSLLLVLLVLYLFLLVEPVASFLTVGTDFLINRQQPIFKPSRARATDSDNRDYVTDQAPSRRQALLHIASVQVVALAVSPELATALVKGVAPPPSMKSASSKPKCTNVEECQALAERKEQEEREAAQANRVPAKKTAGGIIYRDEQEGSGQLVKVGDEIKIYYKVLKLGKRSYDGLSGEGTVVFSRGYGLEDDEKTPGKCSAKEDFAVFLLSLYIFPCIFQAIYPSSQLWAPSTILLR
jgi:hypothetical protein